MSAEPSVVDPDEELRRTLTAAEPLRGAARSSGASAANQEGAIDIAQGHGPLRTSAVLVRGVGPAEAARAAEREQLEASVRRLRRGIVYGLTIWVLFAAVDWVLATHVAPTDVWFLWGLRAAGLVIGLSLLGLLRRASSVSHRALVVIDLLCFSGISVLVTWMSLRTGGLASLYAQGVVTVLVVRAAVLQGHWREAALRLGAPALAYPATILVSALLSPEVAAQLRDPAMLAAFGVNCGFILVTYGFMVATGHAVWALRMQVYARRSLGGYRLHEKLGEGGMGEVWSAEHLVLRREVALKILRASELRGREQSVARFEREVKATAELAHPNVVRIYDGGVTDDGLWYYAMELLQGEDLGQLVDREGALAPQRALRLVAQAARGLAKAHEHGIVHRDVKPENLFVAREGGAEVVKVVDFGIARLLGEQQAATLTQTGLLMGTPLYFSPEVAMGREADERADVYSLGCVLYFALTGSPPHDERNAGALLFAHMHVDPAPPSSVIPIDDAAEVDAVVMRCLAKDPSKRPASMAQLAAELERLAGQRARRASEGARPLQPALAEPA